MTIQADVEECFDDCGYRARGSSTSGYSDYTYGDMYYRVVDGWSDTTNRYFMYGDPSIWASREYWVN